MLTKRRIKGLAATTGLLGSLAVFAVPAHAASVPVTFTTSAGCTTCRTLVLTNTDGSALSGLNLSSGAGGFLASVSDTGIDPAALGNFDVEATMTNLYKETGTSSFDCSGAAGTSIPSSDVRLNSLPGQFDASGLGASLQPVFQITGTLSLPSAVATALSTAGITPVLNPTISGVTGQSLTSLTQSQLAGGSTVTDLIGPILEGATLPLNLSATAGGPFTNPDPSAASPCPVTPTNAATTRQVMAGALNDVPPAVTTLTGPVLADLQSVIGTPTVTILTTTLNQLDPGTALTDIETATKIPPGIFTAFPGLLGTLESQLNATVTGVVDSATTLTGTYRAAPAMGITAPAATVPGTFQGVLTVTLTSAP